MAGTEKPSSSSPGSEDGDDEEEGSRGVSVHQKSVPRRRLPMAVRPETAAEAEKEGEENADEAPSQGASEAAASNEAGGGEVEELLLPFSSPVPRLSSATLSPNSALRNPADLLHPCAIPPGSNENAGPGNPAPQGQVSGSAASGDSKEAQVLDVKSSAMPRTVYPRLPETSA